MATARGTAERGWGKTLCSLAGQDQPCTAQHHVCRPAALTLRARARGPTFPPIHRRFCHLQNRGLYKRQPVIPLVRRFYNLDSQPATRTRAPPANRSGGGRGPGSLPLEPGPFCPQQLVLHTPVGTLGRPPRLLPASFRLKRFPWQGRGALVEKPGPDPLAHRGGRLRTPPPRPG